MRFPFWQAAIVVAAAAVATILTRALPFVLFPPGRPSPRWVLYLGRVLPFAITAMLVVFGLKDTQVLAWPYGLPELISVALVAGLYFWRKNSLLAIGGGTVVYMVLVQRVFAV